MDFCNANDPNPFAQFWADWSNKMMGMAGSQPGTDPREAMARQMRQAFFDAWARCCEDFLASPAFLEVMKRSMDASLAFRQQMNEFMGKVLHETQAPTRSDTDSILLMLHGFEDRLLARMDQMAAKIAALESGRSQETKAEARGSGGPATETPDRGQKQAPRKAGAPR